jgi:hypothetical protein
VCGYHIQSVNIVIVCHFCASLLHIFVHYYEVSVCLHLLGSILVTPPLISFHPHTLPHTHSSTQTHSHIGSTVGIDPLLHGARAVKKIEETLLPKNIIIKAIEKNPIDKIWTENRPLIPDGKLRIHPADYAGKSLDQKLIEIRNILVENEVSRRNLNITQLFLSCIRAYSFLQLLQPINRGTLTHESHSTLTHIHTPREQTH